ncbi:MAG TPA: DinB family protein [Ktedonobacterales bacterium]|nr:DinB family protein [Ktedonobacterales bacterium]
METSWNTTLWRQFGAAIDMLDNALLGCPDSLWRGRLWGNAADRPLPPGFAEFWYVAYHTLFWLDLYLSGAGDDFAPPAPFSRAELDPAGVLPERSYTKEELRDYLASLRQKCQETLVTLTDERARQPVEYPWAHGQPINFVELQMYNMRHVQEHSAQLSLFLGQQAIPDEALGWVPWARDKADSQ